VLFSGGIAVLSFILAGVSRWPRMIKMCSNGVASSASAQAKAGDF
jgi:hypothetical protein